MAHCRHGSCQEVPSGALACHEALRGPALGPQQPLPTCLVDLCGETFASVHDSNALPTDRLTQQHLQHKCWTWLASLMSLAVKVLKLYGQHRHTEHRLTLCMWRPALLRRQLQKEIVSSQKLYHRTTGTDASTWQGRRGEEEGGAQQTYELQRSSSWCSGL